MRNVWTAVAALLLASAVVWAQPSEVARDEQVVCFPTLASRTRDGQAWSIDVHGWIFEEEVGEGALRALEKLLDLDDEIPDPAQRKLLRQRLAPFVVDNERHKRANILIGDHKSLTEPSGKNGHFFQQFELPTKEAQAAQLVQKDRPGRLTYRIELPPGDPRVFTGCIHLLEPRGVSVISDIDDTIRISQVREKKALLASTLLLPFRPVPGMADMYADWAKRYGAELHYVSASPYQLYAPLAEFIDAHQFPAGTFHLKTIRVMDRTILDLFDSAEDYKPGKIEPILKRFPQRTFICVGDSGEKDPEIYGALARQYPQIRQILIRNVSDEGPESPRYARAFRDLPAGAWKVYRDPAEVRELGLAVATSTAPVE